MGIESSKYSQAREIYGDIYLELSHPYYSAGDTVHGIIHLNLKKMFPGRTIYLKIKGKEITSFTTQIERKTYQNGSWHEEKVETSHRGYNKFLDCLSKVFTNENPEFSPGQYSIPFSFKLPSRLASSFSQSLGQHKGEIKYTLSVFLEPLNLSGHTLMYKRKLEIRENYSFLRKKYKSQAECHIEGCCGLLKLIADNSVIIKTNLKKLAFAPDEEIQIDCVVDNTKSTFDIEAVTFSLKQYLTFRSNDNFMVSNVPNSQSITLEGVEAQKSRDYKASIKPSSFPVSTRGNLVISSCFLEIEFSLKNIDFCNTNKRVSIPIQINDSKEIMNNNPPIEPPEDWKPQTFHPIVLLLEEQMYYLPPSALTPSAMLAESMMPGGGSRSGSQDGKAERLDALSSKSEDSDAEVPLIKSK